MATRKPKGGARQRKRGLAPWSRYRWLAAIPVFFLLNVLVQVAKVPSQATGPFEPYFYKTPSTSWAIHGSVFRAHATDLMSPAFLAALAQVEAGGNPIATTYWVWRWSWNPFSWYAPASSAAGLFQITNGTFAESRRFCVHDGKAVAQGNWYQWRGCWFNFLYSRLSASHATEMTSAYLDRQTANLLARAKANPPTAMKRRAAAITHLCGLAQAERFVRAGFRLPKGQRCGDHSVARYLKNVETFEIEFERLARQGL